MKENIYRLIFYGRHGKIGCRYSTSIHKLLEYVYISDYYNWEIEGLWEETDERCKGVFADYGTIIMTSRNTDLKQTELWQEEKADNKEQ